MGAEDNGLTLQGLAQRLETLERENEQMRSENAELRHKVDTLEGSGIHRNEVARARSSAQHRDGDWAPMPFESDGRVSRRSLLSKAGVAAAGLVVAGALTQRDIREAEATPTSFTTNTNARGAVEGTNDAPQGYGVWGKSANTGVLGEGFRGVRGISNETSGYGVAGIAPTGWGVFGEGNKAGVGGWSSSGHGVEGTTFNSDRAGVYGVNASAGTGVQGKGKNGVFGESSTEGQNGVWGKHTNKGAGVSGEGRVGVIGFSHENGWNAVWGRHTGNGRGVAGDSAKGVGVLGESTSGYGGQFNGGKAQLRLVPKGSAGPPTGAHAKGEIYMDKAGTLFVCTAGGVTPTWRRVNTTAV